MTSKTFFSSLDWTAPEAYQDGGDDEGAVGQGVGDVHPLPLRHFRDVEPSRRTPLPHLQQEMKSAVAPSARWSMTPQRTTKQASPVRALSPAALADWLSHQ